MSGHSNLPPEQMTARHLNPDFVPRARYDALLAEVEQLRAALEQIAKTAGHEDSDPQRCALCIAREALEVRG